MPTIQWPKRGTRDETPLARRRILTSRCGRYRVIANHYTLSSMPKRVHALALEDGQWDIISRHRELGPAQRACERHAREHDPVGLSTSSNMS